MNLSTKHEYLYNLNFQGVRVLDLGCGDASCWIQVLENNPDCQLFLYEPDQKVLEKAKVTLLGKNATFLSELDSLADYQFDVITCFAVLEHVFNLNDFFRVLSRLLANTGTAYVNYDDGHFRDHMYLSRSRSFRIRNRLKTQLWFLWRVLGWYSKYQKPINAKKLEVVISKNGLQLTEERYYSLDSFETISGRISEEERVELFHIALKIEDILNSKLSKAPNHKLRGHSDAFLICSSRTLTLKHAKGISSKFDQKE
jgi:SAM-dependent methyltransferase